MRVYKRLTLFGFQWFLDDGLTEQPISKQKAEELILNAKINKAVRQRLKGE